MYIYIYIFIRNNQKFDICKIDRLRYQLKISSFATIFHDMKEDGKGRSIRKIQCKSNTTSNR